MFAHVYLCMSDVNSYYKKNFLLENHGFQKEILFYRREACAESFAAGYFNILLQPLRRLIRGLRPELKPTVRLRRDKQ